jgi:hypothetical protein
MKSTEENLTGIICDLFQYSFIFSMSKQSKYSKKLHFCLGRREGDRHCIEAQRWAFDNTSHSGQIQRLFKIGIFVSCKFSRNLFYILTLSLPELVLYPILFLRITTHNSHIAAIGILRPGNA